MATWLGERLGRGEVVLIDGGMGTELQLRGVPMDPVAWSGPSVLTHADVLRQAHEDYIRAGADVIIANTFAAARHTLEPGGYGDRVAEINRAAVRVAQEARERAADRPVAVAGSISHAIADAKANYPKPAARLDRDWRTPAQLRATFTEQAELLAEAGVDLIALEMLQGEDLSLAAIEAALATGLPVWLGTSCGHPDAAGRLPTFNHADIAFSEAVDRMMRPAFQAIVVMHSEVEDTAAGLDVVRRRWKGALGAYPDTGHFVMPNWHFDGRVTPEALVTAAQGWVAQGAQIIGGCCGVGPEHIRALKDALPKRVPAGQQSNKLSFPGAT